MKVRELIKELEEIENKDAEVMVLTEDSDGCETCGYGASINENDIDKVEDLDTKVWLKYY